MTASDLPRLALSLVLAAAAGAVVALAVMGELVTRPHRPEHHPFDRHLDGTVAGGRL